MSFSFDPSTEPQAPPLPVGPLQGDSPGTRLLASSAPVLASQYSDMLAHEWRMRRRRAESTTLDFAHLLRTDRRIQAYLDAFSLLGRGGSECVSGRLHEALSEGELFALTTHALIAQDHSLAKACIGLVQAMPGFTQVFCSALEWIDWLGVELALSLWRFDDPLRQAVVLRSIAHHPRQLDPDFVAGCVARLAETPIVQLSALRCALATGDAGWAHHAPANLEVPAPEVRLAAAESLLVFGDDSARTTALNTLRDIAIGSGRVAALATRELMTLGGRQAQELMDELSIDPSRLRKQIAAMGWSGDLSYLPRLAGLMEAPGLARAAGSAISLLTGSNAIADRWAVAEPHPAAAADTTSDFIPPRDPDAELPQPDRARFAEWWKTHQDNFRHEDRCLAGQPRSIESLTAILRQGSLAHRPQAAWLLQLATRKGRLAHWAPAPRQLASINGMRESWHHG